MKNQIARFDIKTRQLLKNIVSTFLVKGLALFVGLYTFPAYMRYFSNDLVLGLWFTVISVLSWILTFDLGIGNGLRNSLVKPITENNDIEIKRQVSTAYLCLSAFVIFVIFVFGTIAQFVNWNYLFNISINIISADTMLFMLEVLIIGILVQFLLKLINSIFFAMQRPAIPNILGLCSSILMLFFTLNFKFASIETSIKFLSIAFAFTSNIPYLTANIIMFLTKFKKARPNVKYFSKESVKTILNLGLTFFYLQILALLMFSTNEFIISSSLGPDKVVIYSIFNKIFSILSMLFVLAITPLWSAVTEAHYKKDAAWIKKIQSKLNLLLLIFVPLEALFVVMMPLIQKVWLGSNAIPTDYLICFLLVVYNTLYLKVMIDANIINGIGKLKMQVVALTMAVVFKFTAAYSLLIFYQNINVILCANIIALIPCTIILALDVDNKVKHNKAVI